MSGLRLGLRVVPALLLVPCLAVPGSERSQSTASSARHPIPTGSDWATQAPPPWASGAGAREPTYVYPPAVSSGRPPPLDPATARYWSEKCVSQRASSVATHTSDCDNPAYSTGYGHYPRPYGYPPLPPIYSAPPAPSFR